MDMNMYAATACIYHDASKSFYNISQPNDFGFCDQRACTNVIEFSVLEFV